MFKFYYLIVLSSLLCLTTINAASSLPVNAQQQEVQSSSTLLTKVNINLADIRALRSVKGIGKKTAQAIVDYRKQHGAFKSLDDLLNIKRKGIHKKWLEKVRQFLTI